MAQVIFPFSDLSELLDIGKEEAIETLTLLGFPTEETEESNLNVEVTPNRPDALCVEGIARVLRCYRSGEGRKYTVGQSPVEVVVDPSVSEVRPAFGGAVLRGVAMSDSFLRSMMQLQEKLHETLGRKRRKMAIGIYDLDTLSPPLRYFACGLDECPFVPLEMAEKMTPNEILRRHQKGMDYAHLVGERCPMIIDRNGEVLSFPPIINSEGTKVTESTKNLFLEATGFSKETVKHAVNIVISALAERGGRIEEITVDGSPYHLLQESHWPLPTKEANRILGLELDDAETGGLLAKMGYRMEGGEVLVPGYRADIMNEVDLIEDVAIAYGFNNFEPRLPSFASTGCVQPEHPYHELLIGLGFDEAMTWTLSNPRLQKGALLPSEGGVRISNPLTEDFTIFRPALLPNLLAVLSEGKNEKLPIRIYEIGPVAAPHLERRLALCSMHPRASFSEIKGLVLSLAESTGRLAEIKPSEYGAFVPGRCAAVYFDSKLAGYLGEIAPQALSNFGLEQPVCAAEISVD